MVEDRADRSIAELHVTDSASRERGPVLLSARELERGYDNRPVVRGVSVEVRAGGVLALLGPNAAGKSTLMRLLAGLEPPDAGQVRYRGRAVAPNDRELRRAVAAVLQRPYLWRDTVADNVEFGLRARGVPAAERGRRVRSALERLGVGHLRDAPVDGLSGGERQRVALARALAVEPEILFLDEPMADLDVAVRRRLLEDLERIVGTAAPAIVLITHDPGEAFALADRIAVMEEGRIVQRGTPEEIYESPATEFVASFTGAEFLLRGRVESAGEGSLGVRLESGQHVEVPGRAPPDTPVKIAYRPEDVVVAPPDAPDTSARNRFPATVARIRPSGGQVRLRLEGEGLQIVAVVTRHSMEEMGLAVGTPVTAQIKATALHLFRMD